MMQTYAEFWTFENINKTGEENYELQFFDYILQHLFKDIKYTLSWICANIHFWDIIAISIFKFNEKIWL